TTSGILAAALHPTDDVIRQLLKRKHVAVVGLSSDASKPSYHVAEMMQQHGQYRIIPVRPGSSKILSEPIVGKLSDIPSDLIADVLVDVFRNPDDVEPIVDEAIAVGATAALHPTDDVIRQLLKRKHVAVVGLSSDASKPSYHVAEMMQQHGQYRIIPVRPGSSKILSEPIVGKLSDIPSDLIADVLVDVFRNPDDVEPIVDEAIA
ncbi:CoA-binding protein, putative, partial [Bodo saltans]